MKNLIVALALTWPSMFAGTLYLGTDVGFETTPHITMCKTNGPVILSCTAVALPSGVDVNGIGEGPTGVLYAGNENTPAFYKLDYNLNVLSTGTGGSGIWNSSWNEDFAGNGTELWRLHYNTFLQQIDPGTGNEIRRCYQPDSVGATFVGDKLYVSKYDGAEVGVVDRVTSTYASASNYYGSCSYTTAFKLSTAGGGLAYDADSKVLWVGLIDGSVAPYDLNGNQLYAPYFPNIDTIRNIIDGLAFVPDALTSQNTHLTYMGAIGSNFNDPATLSAKLTDSLGNPISGQPLTFTLGSQSCTGTTAATGIASCTLIPTQAAGGYNVAVSYAGTGQYLSSTTSTPFAITLEQTTLQYTGATSLANGATATLTAVLLEDGVTPIAGRTVTLTLGSGPGAQSCTAVTDATGRAACIIPTTSQLLGPGVVTAIFTGDADYQSATVSVSTLIFAFANGPGNFVIGNLNSALNTPVNFWGAQWWQNNSLTGGIGPAEFKGFEDLSTTAPPSCGATWTTRPGNSSKPPDTIPAYMGVIVSSKITQSGSTTTGDIAQIVVVRTDAGYASNPGHAGTGTVVAVVCSVR